MTVPNDFLTRVHLQEHECQSLKLDIGNYTYGRPEIRHEATDFVPRLLRIGRYCAIAEQVIIFIGRHGRHPTETLTAYPIQFAANSSVVESTDMAHPPISEGSLQHLNRNLDVVIGNDVWIGLGVTIMAGVTIGNGAVIGAKSVVTRNIEPYSIVAGAPAKEIRKRHPKYICERLNRSRWWDLEADELYVRLRGSLYSTDMTYVLSLIENKN